MRRYLFRVSVAVDETAPDALNEFDLSAEIRSNLEYLESSHGLTRVRAIPIIPRAFPSSRLWADGLPEHICECCGAPTGQNAAVCSTCEQAIRE